MGNCSGKVDSETQRNRAIERQINAAKLNDSSKIKLLLLGAGESGKSTLFKQMRLLYSESKKFTPAEKETYTNIIYSNIVNDLRFLIASTEKHTPISSPAAVSIAKQIMAWPKQPVINTEEAHMISTLWKDEGIQRTWQDRGDIQVQDSLAYYVDNIDRIGSSTFIPTEQDILRSRVRTSGVVQEAFQIDSAKFEMYDVGGQRNERRKWLHSFDGVTSVLFVAAISEYNQVLYEDSNVNRQDEAVLLFKQQLESPYFIHTPVILFLNKKDLFREKLPKVPFRLDSGPVTRNVDFEGPHCSLGKNYNTTEGADVEFEACYTAACEYLQELYEKQSPKGRKQGIYTNFTNSTDTKNIEIIMSACKDIILKDSLRNGGWFAEET